MPKVKKSNVFLSFVALLSSLIPQAVRPSSQTPYRDVHSKYVQHALHEQRVQLSAKSTPPPDEVVKYFLELAQSIKSPLPPIDQIDYTKLQLSNPYVIIDQAWELFDLYFPLPETPTLDSSFSSPNPEASQTISPDTSEVSRDYKDERRRFTEAFLDAILYVLNASATGIIGGLVYDVLKNKLEKLRNRSKGKTRDNYDKLISDLDKLKERLRRAEENNESVYIKDMSRFTGGNTELARAWAKSLGWTHQGNGIWHKPFTQSDVDSPQTAG